MKNANSRKATEGTAAAQNIQRQAICPFHDAAMSAGVNAAGMGSAICQFTIWAANIPITMVIWFRLTSLPRMCIGATSAIYMGERPDAIPMPMPPKKRATRNWLNVENAPVAMLVSRNTSADTISSRLRPILSASQPQVQAPTMQPIRAIVMASPWSLTESVMPKYNS